MENIILTYFGIGLAIAVWIYHQYAKQNDPFHYVFTGFTWKTWISVILLWPVLVIILFLGRS